MHEIYELKEMLMKELEEYGSKGELTGGSLDIVDKLAHATKNLCKIIEAMEEEESYSERGGSYEGGSNQSGQSMRGNYSRYSRYGGGGGGSSRDGGSFYNMYRRSYARGRGRSAKRDSRGRYSSKGYSRAEDDMYDIVSELREVMSDLPQEKQQEVRQFIEKIESMDG